MPLPTSASDVTETVKNAAQANGSIAQATRAASGAPVKVSSTAVVASRPISAVASVVKSSAVSRRLGFAPPVSSGPVVIPTGIVSAHTGAKSAIVVSGVNYDLYTFLTTGTNTFVVSDLPITVDIFVLGGGGGGAGTAGGRGGSFTVASNITLAPQSYSLTVGAGGTGTFLGGGGSNGGASSITVSGTTYTGAGGLLGGGNAANGPTSDFTGVVTNYGGQGAVAVFGSYVAGGLGGGGTSSPTNEFSSAGGAGTDGLGGGGGGNRADSDARSGRGGSGRVMIRVRR